MTTAMQAARDRVVEAAKFFVMCPYSLGSVEWCDAEHTLDVAVFDLHELEEEESNAEG